MTPEETNQLFILACAGGSAALLVWWVFAAYADVMDRASLSEANSSVSVSHSSFRSHMAVGPTNPRFGAEKCCAGSRDRSARRSNRFLFQVPILTRSGRGKACSTRT